MFWLVVHDRGSQLKPTILFEGRLSLSLFLGN